MRGTGPCFDYNVNRSSDNGSTGLKSKENMANIHSTAVVAADVQLADDVTIGPFCVVEKDVSIGSGTILANNVVIGENTVIGKNNEFYSHTAIGLIPQMLGWGMDAETGGLEIGDGNVFREQATVHRSMYSDSVTRIGNNNLFMVSTHIGHDSVLGDQIVLTNLVALAGHCRLEDGVWISGLVGVHQFVTMGQWSYVAGQSSVARDVPPFVMLCGSYPTRVRSVNAKGMKRGGFTPEQQEAVSTAFKRLYGKNGNGALLATARSMAQEDGLDDTVQLMLESIEKASQHRYGRHLELARR
jgi:UDP-N-acetylglucosamine acyltransferase